MTAAVLDRGAAGKSPAATTSEIVLNVIHEAGLFQGRLGFKKAILLLEETCEEFSNIHGLGYIPFPTGKISATFEEIRKVLKREDPIVSQPKSEGDPASVGELPERKSRLSYTHSRKRKE
jgi:hypothetical protein